MGEWKSCFKRLLTAWEFHSFIETHVSKPKHSSFTSLATFATTRSQIYVIVPYNINTLLNHFNAEVHNWVVKIATPGKVQSYGK